MPPVLGLVMNHPSLYGAFGRFARLDAQFEARLRYAVEQGEIESDIDPAALARVVCGVMNSLALRARAGDARAVLEATAEATVRLVCNSA